MEIKLSKSLVSANLATLPVSVEFGDGTIEAVYLDHENVSYTTLDALSLDHGLPELVIYKYADPVEGARDNLTFKEARAVAAEDAGLLELRAAGSDE